MPKTTRDPTLNSLNVASLDIVCASAGDEQKPAAINAAVTISNNANFASGGAGRSECRCMESRTTICS